MGRKWDVFISHASEDKGNFVRPLADALANLGVSVWYDEFSLQLGDSISRSIDMGLAESAYGLVIISPAFIRKKWPGYELRGLVTREMVEDKVILPVWHGVTREQIAAFSPTLLDKLAIDTSQASVQDVAIQVLKVVRPEIYEQGLRSHFTSLVSGKEFAEVQKEIALMLDMALGFAELGSTKNLSSLLDDRIKPYDETSELRSILPSYVVRLCQACEASSCSVHSIISSFLMPYKDVILPPLLTAYPQGTPCSLKILGAIPEPTVTTLFTHIFQTDQSTVNWEIALRYLLGPGLPEGAAVVLESFADQRVNHALIRTLVKLETSKATDILALRIQNGSSEERAFILECASDAQEKLLKQTLEDMLGAGLREPYVLSYLVDHGSDLAKQITAEIRAEIRAKTAVQRHEEAWILLRTRSEQQVTQHLGRLAEQIWRLKRNINNLQEPDPSPDDREQGFDVDGMFEEFNRQYDDLSDQLRVADEEYQDLLAGFNAAVEKAPELQSSWEKVLRLLKIQNN